MPGKEKPFDSKDFFQVKDPLYDKREMPTSLERIIREDPRAWELAKNMCAVFEEYEKLQDNPDTLLGSRKILERFDKLAKMFYETHGENIGREDVKELRKIFKAK